MNERRKKIFAKTKLSTTGSSKISNSIQALTNERIYPMVGACCRESFLALDW